MSPTIALKCRLDHGLKRHADHKSSMITSPFRSVSIGSEAELLVTNRYLKVSTENGFHLLELYSYLFLDVTGLELLFLGN